MGKSSPHVRVLVVDDDASIGEYVRTLLGKDGFDVSVVDDPQKAEAALRAESPHLVILDLMMPGVHGLEVLERLRKIDSDVAVVIFTGYPSLETAVAAMKLDAVDYLKKPFEPEELRTTVDRVLKKKGLLRSPEEMLHKHIGETIRGLRKDRNLTLKQTARRTGLSVSLLSQIERAESSASIGSLYKIAVALDVRVADLFGDF
jgi:two-component system, OmpR family, response regulator